MHRGLNDPNSFCNIHSTTVTRRTDPPRLGSGRDQPSPELVEDKYPAAIDVERVNTGDNAVDQKIFEPVVGSALSILALEQT